MTALRLGNMNKKWFLALMGFSGLFLVGCSSSDEPELSLMNDEQAQTDVPVHVAESEHLELENITYVGEGEGFSVFAARDRDETGVWCSMSNHQRILQMTGPWHRVAHPQKTLLHVGPGFNQNQSRAPILPSCCPIISPARSTQTSNASTTTSPPNNAMLWTVVTR